MFKSLEHMKSRPIDLSWYRYIKVSGLSFNTVSLNPLRVLIHSWKVSERIKCFRLVTYSLLTIYAPMIYTAPCIRFLMRADTLCGEVGVGLALEISSFVGPCEIARAYRRAQFGAQKTRDFQRQPHPTSPHNVSAQIKNLKHGAV